MFKNRGTTRSLKELKLRKNKEYIIKNGTRKIE
jgi:hypothetical protein